MTISMESKDSDLKLRVSYHVSLELTVQLENVKKLFNWLLKDVFFSISVKTIFGS